MKISIPLPWSSVAEKPVMQKDIVMDDTLIIKVAHGELHHERASINAHFSDLKSKDFRYRSAHRQSINRCMTQRRSICLWLSASWMVSDQTFWYLVSRQFSRVSRSTPTWTKIIGLCLIVKRQTRMKAWSLNGIFYCLRILCHLQGIERPSLTHFPFFGSGHNALLDCPTKLKTCTRDSRKGKAAPWWSTWSFTFQSMVAAFASIHQIPKRNQVSFSIPLCHELF